MRSLLFMLAAPALLAGCPNKTVPITVQLVTKSCGSVDPMGGVTHFRVRAYGDGLTQPKEVVTTASSSGGQVALPSIPAGTNRQVEIAAFNGAPPNGTLVSVGRTPTFNIPQSVDPSAPPLSFTVWLRIANAFSPTCDASNPDNPPTSMNAAHAAHTATVLADGTVLIAGGYHGSLNTPAAWQATAAAEIYDPTTGLFTSAPPMPAPRAFHTAVLLPSSQVLVLGGEMQGSPAGSPPTLYPSIVDFVSGSTSPWQSDVNLLAPRSRHSSVLDVDPSGRTAVVTFGGLTETSGTLTLETQIEWYDASTTPGTENQGGTMTGGRIAEGVAPLEFSNGIAIALVAGRSDQACPALPICPDSPGFNCSAPSQCNDVGYTCPSYGECISGSACTPALSSCNDQPDGGFSCVTRCPNDFKACDSKTPCATYRSDFDFVRYVSSTSEACGNNTYQLDCGNTPPISKTAILQGMSCATFSSSTRFLCCGGQAPNGGYSAECDGVPMDLDETSRSVKQLSQPRAFTCAVALQDGRTVFIGGITANGAQQSASTAADLYAADTKFSCIEPDTSVTSMTDARAYHACTLLQDGSILVTGGFGGTSGQALSSAEIFQPAPFDQPPTCP